MKKIFTLVLVIFTLITYTQKLEKVKGSKNVILTERVFEEISSLELHKNINLTITKGTENKLEIYADDNLHDIVESEIIDEKLSIMMLYKISGKKKFELTLHITENTLENIILYDNSKLKNADFIEVDDLTIELNDKSNATIFFASNSMTLNINDHAKGEMSLKGKDVIYNLQESGKLKVTSNFDNVIIKTNQKSNITLTGKSDNLDIEAKNSSKVKASNLRVNNTTLIAENSANVYTNTSKELKITAESKSKIYIYGSPNINLVSFKGSAILFKKE